VSTASLIFTVSLGAGFLGAMLGLGGGMFLVPLLTLLLGLPVHTVVATSLLAVIVTSAVATTTYCRSDQTNVRLAFLLETVTALGAIVGGLIATNMSGSGLKLVFGVVAIYTAYSMLTQRRNQESTCDTPEADDALSNYWNVTGVSRRTADEEPEAYQVTNIPAGLGVSFVAGNISAMLGIGGGALKVPIMNLVMRVPLKAATATSTLMVGITASVTALIYYLNGYVDLTLVAPTVFGVLVGAQTGAWTARRTNPGKLRGLLSGVLVILAVQMIAAAF
jgi:hypothetical protein